MIIRCGADRLNYFVEIVPDEKKDQTHIFVGERWQGKNCRSFELMESCYCIWYDHAAIDRESNLFS